MSKSSETATGGALGTQGTRTQAASATEITTTTTTYGVDGQPTPEVTVITTIVRVDSTTTLSNTAGLPTGRGGTSPISNVTNTSGHVSTKPRHSSTSTQQHTNTGAIKTPSHTPVPSEKDSGLSTGAAIGIGIAIAVSIIALLCALGFFWFRRRSRRKRSEQNAAAHRVHETKRDGKSEDAGKRAEGVVASPYELSGRSRAGELETTANRHELDAYRRGERTHELPGDHGDPKLRGLL